MKVNFKCEQISVQGDNRRVILSPVKGDPALLQDSSGVIDFQNVSPEFAKEFSIGDTYEISIIPSK